MVNFKLSILRNRSSLRNLRLPMRKNQHNALVYNIPICISRNLNDESELIVPIRLLHLSARILRTGRMAAGALSLASRSISATPTPSTSSRKSCRRSIASLKNSCYWRIPASRRKSRRHFPRRRYLGMCCRNLFHVGGSSQAPFVRWHLPNQS